MNLTPTEQERLTIFSAAQLAREHRKRGIALSHPEAIAYSFLAPGSIPSFARWLSPQPCKVTASVIYFRRYRCQHRGYGLWHRLGFNVRLDRCHGTLFMNSTLGLARPFDVASEISLPPHMADFGHTLYTYGADLSVYLVVRPLVPSNLRDDLGLMVDA